MLTDVVMVLAAAGVALAVALPLGTALRRYPLAFYAGGLALVAAYLWYRGNGTYSALVQTLCEPIQKGYLACFFLAIVMFTGVLDERSRLCRRLQPIRAELSILSLVLISAHVLAFLPVYLPRLGALIGSMNILAVSLLVAITLTVVYVLLSLFSIRALRAHMPYKVWKRIQRLSYLMVALLWLHIVLALGLPALRGGAPSTVLALGVYTALVAAYAFLRVRRALVRRRRHESAQAHGEETSVRGAGVPEVA